MPLEQPPPTEQVATTAAPLRRRTGPKPVFCLNCGMAATGNFCAECGQENKAHTVALGALLADLLAEVASWDSRLLRTLLSLFVRPGFLTNQYNAGRLVPYVPPLKLYLTISVLFFLLLVWKNPLANAVVISTTGLHVTSTSGLPPTETVTRTNILFEGKIAARLLKAKQNKIGFVNALLNGIPKMMFFLLPGFAVWLKLLYLRTKRLYVEHVVFLLHVHAFGFLILSPLLLFHPDGLIVTVFLVLSAYVLVAMRAVYRQSWIKTLVKFALLSLGYILLFLFCFLGTTLVSLWLL